VPDHVKEQFQLSESTAVGQQSSLTSLVRPAVSKAADDAVADCFFFNSLAFNVANTRAWEEMVEAIARAGPGYKSPTAFRLRTTLLERSYARVLAAMQRIMTQGGWSAYDFVHSRKRNRLGVVKAQQLVYVFQNLRVSLKHASDLKADEYYQWAMHTKVEPEADMLSDSDGDDSSVEDDSDGD